MRRVQQITHHHEAIAPEDAHRPFHLVRRADLEAANAVLAPQTVPQFVHFGIVVDAPFGCAGIRHAEAALLRWHVAVFVHGLVHRRGGVPADGCVAMNRQRFQFRQIGCWHSASLASGCGCRS